jgi:hypothetical protein
MSATRAALLVWLLIGGGLACEPGTTAERVPERERMVRTQLEARGVRDERVLAVMRAVPRHLFVPGHPVREVYNSRLAIGAMKLKTAAAPLFEAAVDERPSAIALSFAAVPCRKVR